MAVVLDGVPAPPPPPVDTREIDAICVDLCGRVEKIVVGDEDAPVADIGMPARRTSVGAGNRSIPYTARSYGLYLNPEAAYDGFVPVAVSNSSASLNGYAIPYPGTWCQLNRANDGTQKGVVDFGSFVVLFAAENSKYAVLEGIAKRTNEFAFGATPPDKLLYATPYDADQKYVDMSHNLFNALAAEHRSLSDRSPDIRDAAKCRNVYVFFRHGREYMSLGRFALVKHVRKPARTSNEPARWVAELRPFSREETVPLRQIVKNTRKSRKMWNRSRRYGPEIDNASWALSMRAYPIARDEVDRAADVLVQINRRLNPDQPGPSAPTA
jgi:hypothetical protein